MSTTTVPTTFRPYEKFTTYPTATEYPTGVFPPTYGGLNYPTEWSRFGGFPSWSNTFSGYPTGYPTSLYPSTYGGMTYPTEWSRFGGFPWWSTTPYTGGFESFPWSREWTSMAPWSRTASPRDFIRDLSSFERSFFNDFERSMRSVERELSVLRDLFNWQGTSPRTGSPKEFSTSMVQLPARPTSSLEYYTFQNPIRFDGEGRRWFRLCFDLPSFKPEEITVTYYSKATPAPYLEIKAAHDVKEAKEHAVKRAYERKYYFPADLAIPKEYFDKLDFKSHVSNDGVLYVEALLPAPSVEEINRERSYYPVWSAPVKTEKRDM